MIHDDLIYYSLNILKTAEFVWLIFLNSLKILNTVILTVPFC